MATAQIGNVNINETLSADFRTLLYSERTWISGYTCTEKYSEAGVGTIYINKLNRSGVGFGTSRPKRPGGNYTHRALATDQVALHLNNVFQGSDEVRDVTEAQVSADTNLLKNAMEAIVNEIAEGLQIAMTAKVADECTDSTAGGNISTYLEFQQNFMADRTALRLAKVNPNFLILDSSIYNILTTEAPGTDFTNIFNEQLQELGIVKKYRGIPVIEMNFSETDAYYINGAGVETAGGLQVPVDEHGAVVTPGTGEDLTKFNYFLGNSDSVALAFNLKAVRTIPAIDFNGLMAQSELVAGFLVPDAERVIVNRKP